MVVIAIDGLVATGKGTTAQWVARELWYTYLDTGAMYRAVTRYAREHDLLEASDERLVQMLEEFHMEFVRNPNTQHSDMWIDGVNREWDIRSTELALVMRPVVVCRPLRARLVELQQCFGCMGDIVADGRDMGTVVFPQAEYKYFLTCDLDVRLHRRIQQLQQQWLVVDEDAIRREIIQRDDTDYLGPDALNTQSSEACIIDTTHLSIHEQIGLIVNDVRRGL